MQNLFSVILSEVKDPNSLNILDSSLRWFVDLSMDDKA
jgi:hypothetical protein